MEPARSRHRPQRHVQTSDPVLLDVLLCGGEVQFGPKEIHQTQGGVSQRKTLHSRKRANVSILILRDLFFDYMQITGQFSVNLIQTCAGVQKFASKVKGNSAHPATKQYKFKCRHDDCPSET